MSTIDLNDNEKSGLGEISGEYAVKMDELLRDFMGEIGKRVRDSNLPRDVIMITTLSFVLPPLFTMVVGLDAENDIPADETKEFTNWLINRIVEISQRTVELVLEETATTPKTDNH